MPITPLAPPKKKISDPSQTFLDTSRLVGGDTRGLGLCAMQWWRVTLLRGCSGIIFNHFGEVPPPPPLHPPSDTNVLGLN